jgi:hypothetical protein
MTGTTEDHEGQGATDQQSEWEKPELEVIPMSEALSGTGSVFDQAQSYS